MIVFNECAVKTMRRMKDNFLDLTVSSPPYDKIRDYQGFKFPFNDISKETTRET